MSGAATGRGRGHLALLHAAILLSVAAAMVPASAAASSAPLPTGSQHSALVLDGRSSFTSNLALVEAARAAGVTVVVTFANTWAQSEHAKLTSLAHRLKLTVVEPFSLPLSAKTAAMLIGSCNTRGGVLRRCAVVAKTPAAAARLSRNRLLEYVVAPLDGPSDVGRLAIASARGTHVIGVVPLRSGAVMGTGWRGAVRVASTHPGMSIAVAPSGPAPLGSYLSLIDGGKAFSSAPPTGAPTPPTGLAVSTSDASSVTLAWTQSASGVIRYRVSFGSLAPTVVAAPSFVAKGLTCGQTYAVLVSAVDAAGRVSQPASVTAATAACAPVSPGTGTNPQPPTNQGGTGGSSSGGTTTAPQSDTSPPSAPSGLAAVASGSTSISLAWSASNDNVGVTGYAVTSGGAQVATVFGASYTLSGLTCGTTYSIVVTALDAAGNRSAAAPLSAATMACPSGGSAVVYLSPAGSDASCARGDVSKPCQTPARAWALAQSGDTIQVADGDYTGGPSNPNWSGCILSGVKAAKTTFTGSSNARFICFLHIDGTDNLALNGITVQRIYSNGAGGPNGATYDGWPHPPANDVTITNVTVTCADASPWYLDAPGGKCSAQIGLSGSNYTLTNVVVGPQYDSSGCGGTGDANKFPVSNSTFRNVTFFDARWQKSCANGGANPQHTENVFLTGASNLTIDGCLIFNDANSGGVSGTGAPDGSGPSTTGMFLSTPGPSNFMLRNCVFFGPRTALQGDSTAPLLNTLIQNNTLAEGMVFECDAAHCPAGYQSLTLQDNIAGTSSGVCPIGAALGSSGGNMDGHNVWWYTGTGGSASQCGSSNIVTTAAQVGNLFVDSVRHDYHLNSSSPALNVGDSAAFAPEDHEGNQRPCGSAPDAGAYETCH